MIIVATHALFLNNKDVYGPAHAISLFLNKTQREHVFIKHRAEGECLSRVEYYAAGKLQRIEEIGTTKRLRFNLRYLLELFVSMKVTLKQSDKCTLFVGADPLNSLAGNLLKFIGKVDKTVFLSADFSLRRFENPFMSKVYLMLDKAAMFWSEQTWSVSQRIVEYRKKQGLEAARNKILPNAPFFDDVKRLSYEEICKYDLVLVSALKKGIVPFALLIDVIDELQKSMHDVRLHIIGSGPQEGVLKNYVSKKSLEHCVKFYGALSHEDMFAVLVKSAIGIAVYEETDEKHFRYFSDSMRTRDYLASGLPVFFSGTSAAGSEILKSNAGRVVTLEKDLMIDALKEVLTNPTLYQRLRRNALRLAKEYDTSAFLKKYFALLG